jgi:hypothetical protein
MRRLIPALMALTAIGFSMVPSAASAATATATANATVNSTSVSLTVNLGADVIPQTVTCNGASCEGLDPYAEGCANLAISIGRVPNVDANGVLFSVTELMFSGKCQAWWAEVITIQPTAPQPYPIIHHYVNATDATPDYSYTGLAINAGNSWTPMVGTPSTQACLGLAPNDFGILCTPVFD